MKIVSITAQKGGVGKSITTFNVASILAKEFGKKVLIIDCDISSSITSMLSTKDDDTYSSILERIFTEITSGKNSNNFTYTTIDIFQKKISPEEVIIETKIDDLFLIPFCLKEYKLWLETEAENRISDQHLINWINHYRDLLINKYELDYIFTDCNNSRQLFNENAYEANDAVIIIVNSDRHSTFRLESFLKAFKGDKIIAILRNDIKEETEHKRVCEGEIDRYQFEGIMLNNIIHTSKFIEESSWLGRPIYSFYNGINQHMGDGRYSLNEYRKVILELFDRGML